jgi:hypothetical protein
MPLAPLIQIVLSILHETKMLRPSKLFCRCCNEKGTNMYFFPKSSYTHIRNQKKGDSEYEYNSIWNKKCYLCFFVTTPGNIRDFARGH